MARSTDAPGGPPYGANGMALPLVLFALVVIGALVAGAFFVGRSEQAVARGATRVRQALAAAEAGAQRQVAEWDALAFNDLAPGAASATATRSEGTGWFRTDVRRLNDRVFLVRSEGFSRDSTARQRVGLLVRLEPLALVARGALTVAESALVGGGETVVGTDAPPPGWPCDSLGAPVPPVVWDSTRSGLGVLDSGSWRARADLTLSGGGVRLAGASLAGDCDRSVPTNWGSPDDPGSPCARYFPLVWATGSLRLGGGTGQGVLVVDGDLTLAGGSRLVGLVLVRGTVRVAGTGGMIVGAAVAGAADLGAAGQEEPVIRYSSCALRRALMGSAKAVPLAERAWVSLY